MDIPKRINGLSLFSGIGGIDLALRDWVRPIAYCEIEPYCQGVLLSGMARGDLSNAPIWPDVRNLHTRKSGSLPCEHIDIIFGGFPCQDISVAGLGKGLEGERSGLFFEIIRLAKEIRPKFIFLENVPAITTRGGLQVIREIAEMGYDCRWCTISAASVGALHKRERWFLLAHAKHNGTSTSEGGRSIGKGFASGEQQQQKTEIRPSERTSGIPVDVADTNSERCDQEQRGQPIGLQKEFTEFTYGNSENDGDPMHESSEQTDQGAESEQAERRTRRGSAGQCWPFESREYWQAVVSTMGKCSNGISDHVARLRCLGNAVVSQQVKEAFKILMGLK